LALKSFHTKGIVEAGCDEAGRGCLAGPVFAAAVILPPKYKNKTLNDSKQLSEKVRYELRKEIEADAVTYAIGVVSQQEIDDINILRASFLAMHRALDQLDRRPESLLIDGNRFTKYNDITHHCIIKGDGIYLAIAAASILAKTYRDEYMANLHPQFPHYRWDTNMGYPTKAHRDAIRQYGPCEHHRKTFTLLPNQLELELEF
jgi:ribonuclease HII